MALSSFHRWSASTNCSQAGLVGGGGGGGGGGH